MNYLKISILPIKNMINSIKSDVIKNVKILSSMRLFNWNNKYN